MVNTILQNNYGKKIGEMTFLEDLGTINGKRRILCICDCGAKKEVDYYNWKKGHSKTCKTKRHSAKIGKRRGKLLVIGVNEIQNETFITCRCKCGNEKTFTLDDFLKSTNCGCEPIKKEKSPKREIVIGEKFNSLTVKEVLGNIHRGRRTVKCECDCGKEITTLFEYLVDGRVKSCGCLRKKSDVWDNVDTTQKISGVSWDNTYERWIVRETLTGGKRKYLGSFKNLNEAIKAKEDFQKGVTYVRTYRKIPVQNRLGKTV